MSESDTLQDKPFSSLKSYNQTILQISLPLPPPELLEKYHRIGLMDKVVELIEKQALHRQQLEITHLDASLEHQKRRDEETIRGQFFAFIIALFAIGGGIIVAIMGYQIAASIISAIGLGGLVARFISGRDDKKTK